MNELMGESLAGRRFTLLLLGLFAALALLLAALGIYGVINLLTVRRTQEMGVRAALGAGLADLLRLVMGQALRLTLAGIVIGLLASLLLTRLLESLLYGVAPSDPLTFAAVSALLTFVSLLACYLPARRAARVDPMVALRYE